MGRTPDRYPGDREETAIILDEQASDPDVERKISFVLGEGVKIFADGVARGIGEGRANIQQPPVDDRNVDTPPGSPTTGYRVIIGDSPTGAFVGHAGEIAQYNGSSWVFSTPQQGTNVYVKDVNNSYRQINTSSPWSWEPGPEPGFGAWYDDEQDDDEIGTTGSWETALELTFPSDLEEGDYIIMCAAIVRGSSSSTQIGVRQVFDSTVLCSVVLQATGTASQVPLSGYHVQKGISGTHTYKIEYEKDGGSGTAYIKNRVIIAFRVA
jgi:hypothetical protein